jgi:hypothetical protein
VKNTLGQLPVEWRNEFELEKNEKKIDWTLLYHELSDSST